jgi:hypothetical protein
MLLILIPIAWLAVATLVVCLCQMAAAGDADGRSGGTRGALRAQVLVLEPARIATLTRAGARSARRSSGAPLARNGLATIHPIR